MGTFSLISCRRSHPLCLLALILKWRTEPNREKQRGYWKINTLNLCEALPLSILFDVLGVPKEKAIPLTVPGLLPLFGGREPKTHPRRWGWGEARSDKSSTITPWWSTPLQYSCLENPMDRGAWWAAVHGVAKSQTRLSNFTFTLHFHALEKEMATHSSVLVWRIPGTGEPGGLLSMGSHRVGHNWSNLAAAAGVPFKPKIPVRRTVEICPFSFDSKKSLTEGEGNKTTAERGVA